MWYKSAHHEPLQPGDPDYRSCQLCGLVDCNDCDIEYDEWIDAWGCPDCLAQREEEREADVYGRNYWNSLTDRQRDHEIKRLW